jgi:hypothetical protein
MFQPLDGPAAQGQQNVSDSVVFEVRKNATALSERDVVTIYPIDGQIWVYFGDDTASAPNAATVKAEGFPQYRDQEKTYEAGPAQPIYIVADTGTVDVRYAERG